MIDVYIIVVEFASLDEKHSEIVLVNTLKRCIDRQGIIVCKAFESKSKHFTKIHIKVSCMII